MRGNFLHHTCEDFDRIGHPLNWPEIRKMNQNLLIRSGIAGALLRAFLRAERGVEIAVHEICDDFDVTLDLELFERALPQVVRDRCNAVALLDRKSGDRKIGTIQSYERDI